MSTTDWATARKSGVIAMTTKADIDAAQNAIDAANNAIGKLDLCGLYDCAWQAHDGYQRIIDYNRENLEVAKHDDD